MKSRLTASTGRALAALALTALACAVPLRADEKAAAAELKVGGLTFKPSEPWKLGTEERPMSKGSFVLPAKEGSAELTAVFYHFGTGQGGGFQANVQRWQGMFASEPPIKTEEGELPFGEQKARTVTIHGTYKGSAFSPEKEPRQGWALVAIVVPHEKEGDVYIRLVGPEKDVAAAKEHIAKLVASAAK